MVSIANLVFHHSKITTMHGFLLVAILMTSFLIEIPLSCHTLVIYLLTYIIIIFMATDHNVKNKYSRLCTVNVLLTLTGFVAALADSRIH